MADETKLEDFPSLFSLKDKVVVVTGGSRGLGLHAASAFLQAGASKVFVSSRKAPACEAAVKRLNSLPNLRPGARAISAPADSSTLEGVKSLLAQVQQHTSHVDVLFANAGATWGAPFDSHPDAAFQKVMDLNVRAVFNTVREFAPLLTASSRNNGGGKKGAQERVEDPSRVIVTGSVAGIGVGTIGKNGTYGYSASKAAVIHLAKNLALELGPRGVTVNAIAPGFFPSKMANGLLEIAGGQGKIAKANPMGRLGRPEDIAGAVVYLASRAASHVNGIVLPIDGGAVLARGELLVSEDDEPASKL